MTSTRGAPRNHDMVTVVFFSISWTVRPTIVYPITGQLTWKPFGNVSGRASLARRRSYRARTMWPSTNGSPVVQQSSCILHCAYHNTRSFDSFRQDLITFLSLLAYTLYSTLDTLQLYKFMTNIDNDTDKHCRQSTGCKLKRVSTLKQWEKMSYLTVRQGRCYYGRS